MKSILLALLLIAPLQSFAAEHVISMKNMGKEGAMEFDPGFINAKVGDTLKFVATDTAHQAESVLVPKGAKPFKGQLDKGFTYKLTSEGVYVYQCDPHAAMNMAAVIQVGKPANLPEATKAVEGIEAKAVMNKGRLKGYLAKVK